MSERAKKKRNDPARGMVSVVPEKRGRKPLFVVMVATSETSVAWVSEFSPKEHHSALNVAEWLRSAIRYAVKRDRCPARPRPQRRKRDAVR